MLLWDTVRFAAEAVRGYRTRTYLMLLAMAIGVASVVVLTGLGEGARRYITDQFSSLGTNLLTVFPGRTETTGGPPPMGGETPRDLTLDDALMLSHIPAARYVAPISVGSAPVSWRQREREVTVVGSTADLLPVRHLSMHRGRFLPEGDPSRATPVCVLGYSLYKELFGNEQPIGQSLRIGDYRFRVIGVLSDLGMSLGMDTGDMVIIPVASAQALFNTSSLFRILISVRDRSALEKTQQRIIDVIRDRHEGEEDVTVISQDALLSTFDRIFTALTLTVGGIAGVSLLVAGILIMNVMLVAVTQRTAEIGLLKALGAPSRRIMVMFLVESAVLSLLGAILGIAVGFGGNWLLSMIFPDFPIHTPLWAIFAAVGVSVFTGLIFGVLPARRAARLDPVQALSRR